MKDLILPTTVSMHKSCDSEDPEEKTIFVDLRITRRTF